MAGNLVPTGRQISLSRNAVADSLRARSTENAKLNERLATGIKIAHSSDDPTGYAIARRLDSFDRQYDQITRSIESARSWTDNTQDSLDDIANLVTSAYEEGIKGANSTLGAAGRAQLADRVDHLINEVVERLNTRTADGYIFGGTSSTVKPFVLDNAAGSDGAGVSYYGNSSTQERTVGIEMRLEIGIAGSRMTGAGGVAVTEALGALRDALNADDQTAIDAALGDVIIARDHTIDLTAESGVAGDRLSHLFEQASSVQLRLKQERSSIEDADIAETITDLQRNQTSLQAAMQAVAGLYQNTLLNYLR
ncbi:MAG: flagellar hook-associated protein 3 FlgL [Kiritimatiellia bacterium]|jgi:flagellar hook-associated protein 3 FlgL